jgi:hypothetical protein
MKEYRFQYPATLMFSIMSDRPVSAARAIASAKSNLQNRVSKATDQTDGFPVSALDSQFPGLITAGRVYPQLDIHGKLDGALELVDIDAAQRRQVPTPDDIAADLILNHLRALRDLARDVVNHDIDSADIVEAIRELKNAVHQAEDELPFVFRKGAPRKPRIITVTVEGGVVQSVDDIPPGVTVSVLDFDTDGVEEHKTKVVNDKGERALVSDYVGR